MVILWRARCIFSVVNRLGLNTDITAFASEQGSHKWNGNVRTPKGKAHYLWQQIIMCQLAIPISNTFLLYLSSDLKDKNYEFPRVEYRRASSSITKDRLSNCFPPVLVKEEGFASQNTLLSLTLLGRIFCLFFAWPRPAPASTGQNIPGN